MNKSVYEDVARYFAAVSEQLKGEARQAGLLENASIVGGDREEVFRRFLEPKNIGWRECIERERSLYLMDGQGIDGFGPSPIG